MFKSKNLPIALAASAGILAGGYFLVKKYREGKAKKSTPSKRILNVVLLDLREDKKEWSSITQVSEDEINRVIMHDGPSDLIVVCDKVEELKEKLEELKRSKYSDSMDIRVVKPSEFVFDNICEVNTPLKVNDVEYRFVRTIIIRSTSGKRVGELVLLSK